ncbi:MAG: FAD binding domain-containing protein, partial [Chloroflexota bacterium]
MIPAAFEYHAPSSLREALGILRRYPGEAKVLAGGHSLLPMMKLRLARPAHLVDLRRIADLAYIRERDGGLAIGPMTTYYMLEASSLVRQRAPALAEAAGTVADLQVRNKGTIGGSLAHADPAADLPAVIVAMEGRVHTAGGGRSRRIPAHRFFVDIFTTALRETEIISEIFIPPTPSGTGGSYQKFANKASHFAVVGVAALVTLGSQRTCQGVRIGITGAGPRAVRARAAERYL